MKGQVGIILLALLALGGCASKENLEAQANYEQNQQQVNQQGEERANTLGYQDPRDPLEGFNRVMWDFNYDVLDEYILRPVTVAYVDYVPSPARKGLHNAALNLEEPSNTVNNLLQGKVGGSMASLGRFLINSTVGMLGLFDVATPLGLERQEEEFGEVLGVYGIGTGAYLMIPALGPSDIRTTVGDFVDTSYFPLQDLTFYASAARAGIKALENRAQLIEQEAQLEQSLDPYAFVKNAYFQNLQFKVTDGKATEKPEVLQQDEENFDDFLDGL